MLPEGWTFEGKRVLDFGCGAGRTLVRSTDEGVANLTPTWVSACRRTLLELARVRFQGEEALAEIVGVPLQLEELLPQVL